MSQMARTRTEWMAVPFLKVRNIGGEKCFQGEDDVILGGRLCGHSECKVFCEAH